MASYLLKPVIVRLLNTYVENGGNMEVNIHVTGLFEMSNIIVKTDAIMEGFYNLPFHLKTLTVGKLRVEVPILKMLTSKPLTAELSHVRIVLEWGDLVNLPKQEQLEEMIKASIAAEALIIWDEFRRLAQAHPGEANLLGRDDESMVTRALTKLMKNIHVKVDNVEVTLLLKDGRSIIASLDSAETFTTDPSFSREIFDNEQNRVMHKLVNLKGFRLWTVTPTPSFSPLPKRMVTMQEDSVDSNSNLGAMIKHSVLGETDAELHMTFDNRGDKTPDIPSMDFRILFLSSVDIHARPCDLALISRVIEEYSCHASKVESATRKYVRRLRRGIEWEKLMEEYLNICVERWQTNFQPAASSPRQQELELLLDSKDIRGLIERSMWKSTGEVMDPTVLSKQFDPFLDNGGFLALKQAPKFPSAAEFDVVFTDPTRLGIELDMEESERLQKLVVFESSVYPDIIRRNTVILVVNGYWLNGLDFDTQLQVLSKAKRPTKIRFSKPDLTRGLTARILAPSITLQFGVDPVHEAPESELTAPLELDASCFHPLVRLTGFAFQYDCYISSVIAVRLSLLGADGPLFFGGVERFPSDSRESFACTQDVCHKWLGEASVETELPQDNNWRRILSSVSANAAVSSQSPLISGLVLVMAPSELRFQGRIGAFTVFVNDKLEVVLAWLNQVSANIATAARDAELVAPAPPPVSEQGGASTEVAYSVDLEVVKVQLLVQLRKSRSSTWKQIVCALEKARLKSNSETPNRIQANMSFFVQGDQTRILGFEFRTLQIALDTPGTVGVSMNLYPEPIVITELALIQLMNTKKEFDAQFPFLFQSESSATPSSLPVNFSDKSLQYEARAIPKSPVSISEACGQALTDVFSFRPDLDEEFTLSPAESVAFFLAMKRLGYSVPVDLGMRLHNLSDIIEFVQSSSIPSTTTVVPSSSSAALLIRVGLVVSEVQLTLYKFGMKIDHLIVGAVTAPQLSGRCEVKNLRFDDNRLKSDQTRESQFLSRFFVVKELVASYSQFRKGNQQVVSSTHETAQPFVDIVASEVRTPDVSSICPLELLPQHSHTQEDRDDIHLAISGFRLRVTYDLLDSLLATLMDISSLTTPSAPGNSASEMPKRIDSTLPPPPPTSTSSSAPVTSPPSTTSPSICASVRLSGFSVAIEDLTRRCEKARRMYRYQSLASAIATAMQESHGQATVAMTLNDGITGAASGDAEIRSIFLTFEAQESGSKARLSLNHISLNMSVNEIQMAEEKNTLRFTEVFQRSRTIMNPMGVTANVQLRSKDQSVTFIAINVDKPLSFSIWAEELTTFQEILFAQAPEAIPERALHEELKTHTPMVVSPRPDHTGVEGGSAVAALRSPTAPSKNLHATTSSHQRRVTFQSHDSTTSSSRESFYTAFDEEPGETESIDSSSSPKQIFVVRLTCDQEVGLEIVKRSLARVAPDAFLPVLWFVMTPVQLSLYTGSMGKKDFTASCLWGMEARIYNLRLAVWEPLVEHFRSELYARKVLENQSKIQLAVVSRVNVNISEVNARLLQKLINDFTSSLDESWKNKQRKFVIGSKKTTAATYLLSNDLGDDLLIETLFQVGCGSPGILRIEVRDAWTLPDRARWQKHPKIEAVVHPWKDKLVIAHRPPQPNAAWLQRPLLFAFKYLGTTTEFPMLEITVNDEYIAMVELASHIIDPKPGGTSEWVGLRKNGGTITSELLLKISFESDPHVNTTVEKWTPMRLGTSSSMPVSFDRVSPNKKEMMKSLNFIRKGAQNTMRGAHLSLNVFNNIFSTQLLMDETGSYAMHLEHERTIGMDSLPMNGLEVFVKSAMRPGGKRVIQIESPLIIQNQTNVPIEIFITDREFDCTTTTEAGDSILDDSTLSGSGDEEEKEEKSDAVSELTSGNMFRWFEVLHTHEATKPEFEESSSLGLADAPRYTAIESNELPLPLKAAGFRIRYSSQAPARMTHWKLFARTKENDSWKLLLQIPERDSSRSETRSQARENSEIQEEKQELLSETFDFEPIEIVALRLECYLPQSLSRKTTGNFAVPTIDGHPRLQSEPGYVDNQSMVGEEPIRASSTIDVKTPKKTLWGLGQSLRSALQLQRSVTMTSSRSIKEVFASLGVANLDVIPALGFATWKCKLCQEDNRFGIERCTLCNLPRKPLPSSLPFTPTPTPSAFALRKGLSSASLVLTGATGKATGAITAASGKATGAITTATGKATARLSRSFRNRPTKKTKCSGFFRDSGSTDDRSLKKVLEPGDRFPIPVRYLFVKGDPFKVYVRPSMSGPDVSWARLIERIGELKDAAPPRTWLRCSDFEQKSKVVLSAHVQSRFVPLNSSERGGTREDKRPNRFKVGVVPWLVIQNALPYALSLRFFDGLTPRDDITVLQPGMKQGFMTIDEQSLVQFKVEGYNSLFGWSGAVHPYREDTSAYSTSRVHVDPTFMKRVPRRKEVLTFVHEKSGKTLRLVMERSNDSRASLQCVIYAVCWVYNYSDIGLSVKGGRSLLGTASAAAASRTSNSGSAPEDSYFLSPQGRPETEPRDLLPALVYTPNDVVRLSGVMGWSLQQWHKWVEQERWPVEIQPMEIIQIVKMKRLHPMLNFSRPRFNVKLTSSVLSCDFIFATISEVRLVTVEVRRPDTPPFSRSTQVIVRPRFILMNTLSSCTILFKEAFLMSLVASPGEYLNELIPAEIDVDDDDLKVVSKGTCLGWTGGTKHQNPNSSSDLQVQPQPLASDGHGSNDALPFGNEPVGLLPTRATNSAEEERGGAFSPKKEGFATKKAASGAVIEHETRLGFNQPVPYHFVRSKHSQKFVFAVEPTGSTGSTSWSGTITLGTTDCIHCVLLRDKNGSAREADPDAGLLLDIDGQQQQQEDQDRGKILTMGAMRVRVEISPRPNGSTMVIFSEDGPNPSFQIENLTQYSFEVKQTQTNKGNLIVASRATVPIGWDEPMKPTSLSIRALVPFNQDLHAKPQRKGRFSGALISLFHADDPRSALIRESGRRKDEDTAAYFPVSAWQTYAMETVSEREPLRLENEQAVLRAEGIVNGSTLVLRLSEEFRHSNLAVNDLLSASQRKNEDALVSEEDKEAAEDAALLASTMYDPFKCLLAVRIEHGYDLDICEQWQNSSSSKFMPYVVVSVMGHTKQSTPKLKGDVYNPDWTGEKPLLFECQYMPRLISFSVLNQRTDEREVIGLKRVDIPKSLFLLAAQSEADKKRRGHAKLSFLGVQTTSFSDDENEDGSNHLDDDDVEEQKHESKSLLRTVSDDNNEAFVSALEEKNESPKQRKVNWQSEPEIEHGEEEEEEEESFSNGWVAVGSAKWESLIQHDLELERKESEYAMSGLRAAGSAKTAADLLNQSDPYIEYETFFNRLRIAGEAKAGTIELAPMFVKESSVSEQARESVTRVRSSVPNVPTSAAATSIDKTKGAAAASTQDEVLTEAQRKPKLRISIKVLRLPVATVVEEKPKEESTGEGETKVVISPRKNFINGVQTDLAVRVSSVGLSIINVAKRQEIAYLCLQRAFFNRFSNGSGYLIESSLGNIQLDNKVPNAQFPVSISRVTGPLLDTRGKVVVQSPFAHVKIFVHTLHPSVMFVETFRASVGRLNIAFEERFLGEVAGVFVRSSQDLRGIERSDQAAFVKEQVAVVPCRDSKVRKESFSDSQTASDNGGGNDGGGEAVGTKMMMIYLDSFEIHPLRVTINLDLEGGREIDEPDDAIAAGVRFRIPLLTLEVRDLFLRIAGMRRGGWFVSPTAFRGIVTRHFIHQGLLNLGRILTNTNWAGNPLQAGKSVASGFYFLIREPVVGARDAPNNPIYGFFHGLSAGSTALFANVATGLSETVHGLTNTTVSAFTQLDSAIEYDVTTRPVASVVEVLRDVSGALASSAREITDEVVALRSAKPVPLRQPRDLGPEGLIVPYGGGYLPQSRMIVEERLKAQLIQRAWRRHWKRKTEATKRMDIADLAKEAKDSSGRHINLVGEQPKPGVFRRLYNYIAACCLAFQTELEAVRSSGSGTKTND